jgi:uncharacterized protein (DUF2141 family)
MNLRVERTKLTYLLAIHSFLNSVQIRDRILATTSTKEKTMTVRNFNFGFLTRGVPKFENVVMNPDGTTKTDIFQFTTGFITENVAISASDNANILPGFSIASDAFALALFQETNGNGVLDNEDRLVLASDGTSDFGGAFEAMNVRLTQGTYFARTTSFATEDIAYLFRAARAKGNANPLTSPEIQIGQISEDLQRSDTVSDKDTADNFAFTLDGSSSLNINVRELGNKKGDANIRIVQDLDSDGFVDKNEVVVKGISTRNGNVDTITGMNKAGDYILQVCQTQGKTKFEVNFDPTAG